MRRARAFSRSLISALLPAPARARALPAFFVESSKQRRAAAPRSRGEIKRPAAAAAGAQGKRERETSRPDKSGDPEGIYVCAMRSARNYLVIFPSGGGLVCLCLVLRFLRESAASNPSPARFEENEIKNKIKYQEREREREKKLFRSRERTFFRPPGVPLCTR